MCLVLGTEVGLLWHPRHADGFANERFTPCMQWDASGMIGLTWYSPREVMVRTVAHTSYAELAPCGSHCPQRHPILIGPFGNLVMYLIVRCFDMPEVAVIAVRG